MLSPGPCLLVSAEHWGLAECIDGDLRRGFALDHAFSQTGTAAPKYRPQRRENLSRLTTQIGTMREDRAFCPPFSTGGIGQTKDRLVAAIR